MYKIHKKLSLGIRSRPMTENVQIRETMLEVVEKRGMLLYHILNHTPWSGKCVDRQVETDLEMGMLAIELGIIDKHSRHRGPRWIVGDSRCYSYPRYATV